MEVDSVIHKVVSLCKEGDLDKLHTGVNVAVNELSSGDSENSATSQFELLKQDILMKSLIQCVSSGQKHGVQSLLQIGVNVNGFKDSQTKNPLHTAIELGQTEIVQCLLQAGAEVNKQGSEGITALHLAVLNNHTDIVELLLTYPVDPELKTATNKTALDFALQQDNKDIVQLLVNKIDSERLPAYQMEIINFASQYGDTEFLQKNIPTTLLKSKSQKNIAILNQMAHKACLHNNRDVVTLLLEHNVNFRLLFKGTTAIQIACNSGSLDLIRLLLFSSHKYIQKNQKHVLYATIESNRTDVLQFLLQNKVNLHVTDTNGQTPLHFACAVGNTVTIDLLLKHGVGVNAQDKRKLTPLMLVLARPMTETRNFNSSSATPSFSAENKISKKFKSKEYQLSSLQQTHVVSALLSSKADVNMRSRSGWTALHYAVSSSNTKATRMLLAAGADINAQATYSNLGMPKGSTPLCVAVLKSAGTGVIESLLKAGAKANIQICKSNIRTPLTAAVKVNNATAVRMLVAHGCDTETPIQKFGTKYTSLQLAVSSWKVTVAMQLIKSGANVNVLYRDHDSLLHTTLRLTDKLPLIKCLLKHGVDVNAVNDKGQTALHLFFTGYCNYNRISPYYGKLTPLIRSPNDVKAAKAIIRSSQTDLDIRHSVTGNTALIVAVNHMQKYQDVVIEYLIDHGANVNLQNNDEKSALHIATEKGHFDVVVLLVEKGCVLSLRDRDGNTALDVAVHHLKEKCAVYLLNKSDPSEALNEVLLHRSAARKMTEVMHLLLQRGCSVNARVTHALYRNGNNDLKKFTVQSSNILSILLFNWDYKSIIPVLEAGFEIHSETELIHMADSEDQTCSLSSTKELQKHSCFGHGFLHQWQTFLHEYFRGSNLKHKIYGVVCMLLLSSGASAVTDNSSHTDSIISEINRVEKFEGYNLPLLTHLLELGYCINWDNLDPEYYQHEHQYIQDYLSLLRSQSVTRLEVLAARTVRSNLWPNAWVSACKLPLPAFLYNVHFVKYFQSVKKHVQSINNTISLFGGL